MSDPREALLALLEGHAADDDEEYGNLVEMRHRARTLTEPFSRKQPESHFTGSAVVVDPPGARVLLVHHATLDRWLQPGGHAEATDAGSLLATALREAREETGLRLAVHAAAPCPLDVDVHRIPEAEGEPAHAHLDVRFLVVAAEPDALAHDPAESHGAQWLSWNDALARAGAGDPALVRLLEKARRWSSPGKT